MKVNNPFLTKGYVSPEYFCDREEETEKLLQAIKNGRDLVLYGKRKMGKSALIKHVFHHLGPKVITVWIDLLPSQNFDEMLTLTANAVLHAYQESEPLGKKIWAGIKKLRPTFNYDEYSGVPNVSFDLASHQASIDTFSELISLLAQNTKKVVLAFDEFQQISTYSEKNIEGYLRTLLQSLPNVAVIFSGSDQQLLLQMFDHIDRPFYNFGEYLRLGPIEADKYVDYIKNHFNKHKKKIDAAEIYEILEWCNYRTMNVQIIANRLFSKSTKSIKKADIENIKETIIREKEDIYYTLRRVLSKGQWRVLVAFAIEGKVYEPYGKTFMKKHKFTNSSTIRRVVQYSTERGLLYHSNDGDQSYFELDDIFLRRWIEMIRI